MATKHIHIHVGGKTKDYSSNPQIAAAQKEAASAIKNAGAKVVTLKNVCKDADDKSQCDSARRMLNDALGKVELEVLG